MNVDVRRSFHQPPVDGKKKEHRSSKRRLNQGQIVKSKAGVWTVAEILGSGGFGDVYKVSGQKKSDAFAMKTEYRDPKKRKAKDRLKVETQVLSEFNNQPDPEKTKHFLKMIDKGMTESFKFIVMTLVSHSLDDLRKILDTMTWATHTHIALQTLKAIEDLHACGYMHRDIKPHNFAIGLPPKDTTIFMIDFGIARPYVDKDGKLRIPRQSVSFLGTARYASRNCHNDKEQSRRDDLESWCYLVIEFFNLDNLNWRRVTDRTKITICKNLLMTRQDKKEIDAPKTMYSIIEYVNELGYTDAPDYDKIRDWLIEGAKDQKLDLTRKLDWIDVELRKSGLKKGPLAANRITDDDDNTEPEKKAKKEERRKRFSDNEDSSSSDDAPVVRKQPPPTRRTIARMALAIPPSAKGARTRRQLHSPAAHFGSIPGAPGQPNQLPPPSGVRMAPGGGGGPPPREQIASAHPIGPTGGPNGLSKSNYNTAIPRTPSRESLMFNMPSSKKKGGG